MSCTEKLGGVVDCSGVYFASAAVAFPGSDRNYALGCAELRKIAKEVSHHTGGSCVLEVIPFPSRIVLDNRNRDTVEGMIRIRISHGRGLDRPAGPSEEHA